MKFSAAFSEGAGNFFILVVLFLSGVISLGTGIPYPAEGVEYQITDLGTIGTDGSIAYDINDFGLVVGRVADASNTNVNGFIWGPQSGMQMLTPLGGKTKAWGIGNTGRIAGQSNSRAVLWNDADAVPQDLGTLGGPTSFAYGINNNDQIVGWADKPEIIGFGLLYHAFLSEWDSSAQQYVMTDIGTLASDQSEANYWGGYSLAYFANSAGRAVGVASTDGWYYHAFAWDKTNGMTDLGTNPDHPVYEGYAAAINESGNLIVGCSIDSSDPNNTRSYPMIWRNGSTAAELIPTLAAFPYAELYDVNGDGEVVGLMFDGAGNEHALIYEMGAGIQDLNDLITGSSGWELNYARSINEAGKIVGYGKFNGEDRAYMLTPKVNFSASTTAGYGPAYICFTDMSIDNPESWLWDFGDGTTSTLQNPCHMYKTPGNYTVSLTVFRDGGPVTMTKNAYISLSACANSPVRYGTNPSYTYDTSIGSAYGKAGEGQSIQAQALDFNEDLNIDAASVILQGGYVCDYSANSGVASVHSISIGAGMLTVENVIIQ